MHLINVNVLHTIEYLIQSTTVNKMGWSETPHCSIQCATIILSYHFPESIIMMSDHCAMQHPHQDTHSLLNGYPVIWSMAKRMLT